MASQKPSSPQNSTDIDAGLCLDCTHARLIRSDRGTIFYRCERSDTDPRFAKYPTLPVIVCSGYESKVRPE